MTKTTRSIAEIATTGTMITSITWSPLLMRTFTVDSFLDLEGLPQIDKKF